MSQVEHGEWVLDPAAVRVDLAPPGSLMTMTFQDLPQEVIDLFMGQSDGSGKPCRVGVYAPGGSCGPDPDDAEDG